MPSVTLNGTEYKNVEPKFLDSIAARLSNRLLQQRALRVATDFLAVKSELLRLYGQGLAQKPWYQDFIVQFCRDRKIPCRKEDL